MSLAKLEISRPLPPGRTSPRRPRSATATAPTRPRTPSSSSRRPLPTRSGPPRPSGPTSPPSARGTASRRRRACPSPPGSSRAAAAAKRRAPRGTARAPRTASSSRRPRRSSASSSRSSSTAASSPRPPTTRTRSATSSGRGRASAATRTSRMRISPDDASRGAPGPRYRTLTQFAFFHGPHRSERADVRHAVRSRRLHRAAARAHLRAPVAGQERLHYRRTLRVFVGGACYAGPCMALWYPRLHLMTAPARWTLVPVPADTRAHPRLGPELYEKVPCTSPWKNVAAKIFLDNACDAASSARRVFFPRFARSVGSSRRRSSRATSLSSARSRGSARRRSRRR